MDLQERYSRQIILPDIGEQGQQRLLQSRVLIVGVGGLGSPIALYLTAAGVGHIGLIDDDVVSLSNLQRQVLYTTDEVGKSKVACAVARLQKLSPHTQFTPYDTRLTQENATDIISQYDIVVDGCDNAATRYLIDDVCVQLHKPYVYGAISEYSGQVSIFCTDGGRRYRDIFPSDSVCSQPTSKGVIGVLPGLIGSIEAAEVIKLITGAGSPLVNRLYTVDIRTMQSLIIDME